MVDTVFVLTLTEAVFLYFKLMLFGPAVHILEFLNSHNLSSDFGSCCTHVNRGIYVPCRNAFERECPV